MKFRLLLAIITFTIFHSCIFNNDFLKIDKNYTDRKLLISNIIPNKDILYWKYVETLSNKVVREVGNRKLLAKYKIEEPSEGFFSECMPGYCYSYIVYIDNKGLHYVTNEKTLLSFIRTIDNISEAILVAKTQGLWIDQENEKGGSYKKTKTGYKMNLLKYNGCPETYESIFFTIDFDGQFNLKSNGIYKKTDNCIVS